MEAESNMGNFQRKGATDNTTVGRRFEKKVERCLVKSGFKPVAGFPLAIGTGAVKKNHRFDFGDESNKTIIECKAHTWTESGNVPSAKMTTWDQAMYFFFLASNGYRKMLVVQLDRNTRRNQTLGEYYINTKPHLIPSGVEIWEYNEKSGKATKIW